jgi:hypothetical protein
MANKILTAQRNIHFTVLENGLDYIADSAKKIVDLRLSDPSDDVLKRELKYAVLHLAAGIELIHKQVLYRKHWLYVFDDMNNAIKTKITKGDFKSCNPITAIKRLKQFLSIELSGNERRKHSRLRNFRNRLQHFDFYADATKLELCIYDNIHVVLSFISDNFSLDEFTDSEKQLYEDIKTSLNELSDFATEAREMIEKLIDDHIENKLGITQSDVRKGAEYPLYYCPECGEEAFVYDEDGDKFFWKCFYCNVEYSSKEIGTCDECGNVYWHGGNDEILICSDCVEYKMGND